MVKQNQEVLEEDDFVRTAETEEEVSGNGDEEENEDPFIEGYNNAYNEG